LIARDAELGKSWLKCRVARRFLRASFLGSIYRL
jgi:hypothetical protein